ncbi:MAG: hypothetical protein GY801_26700, partial [bacterium]|nr:hypothetical protein [bacterium]
MMKYQLKGMQSVAIGCVSVVMLCLIGWQGDVEAASDCYLKCFTTGEGTKICVVEGHRLYEKITIRAENGDQCFSSITQARSAGFVVVGESASKPAEAQRRPKVIPAAPVESPEALPDETPEPAPDTPPETAPLETEQAVEAVAPESPEASEVPEDVDDEIPEEAPPTPMSDEELSPAENEKQALIAKLTDDSLDMAEREQAYQQLMNHPDLTEEEKQGLEFTWNFIHEGG